MFSECIFQKRLTKQLDFLCVQETSLGSLEFNGKMSSFLFISS